MKLHYFNIYKLTTLFFQKSDFCLYWGQKDPKIEHFILFLENIVILFSLSQAGRIVIVILVFSGTILGLELLFQMFSTNQIAGFLKALYLKNELRYKIDFLCVSSKSIDFLCVSSKSIGLGQT